MRKDVHLALLLVGLLASVFAACNQTPEAAPDQSGNRPIRSLDEGRYPAKTSGASVRFRKIVIDRQFRSEGAALGDVDRNGRIDILAGNLWYEAPSWRPHVILPLRTFDKAEGYSNSFINSALDVNDDGWVDQVVIGFPGKEAVWRENPRGDDGPWREHLISATAGNESPALAYLVPDGPPVLVFGIEASTMAWLEPARSVTDPWARHVVSEPEARGARSHGLGIGDLDGDGRNDIVVTNGYWAAPADPREGPWSFVAADFGRRAAQMAVYDVNGDGTSDVITSSPHNKGVWWFEQQRTANDATFVRHTIDESFSQSHALAMSDINGDGLLDIVTGKRFWAHGPTGDVEPNAPAVLCWFELQRNDGRVSWVKHPIDDDSGVGTQVVAEDVDGDAFVDIVVANKKGVFVFIQER